MFFFCPPVHLFVLSATHYRTSRNMTALSMLYLLCYMNTYITHTHRAECLFYGCSSRRSKGETAWVYKESLAKLWLRTVGALQKHCCELVSSNVCQFFANDGLIEAWKGGLIEQSIELTPITLSELRMIDGENCRCQSSCLGSHY